MPLEQPRAEAFSDQGGLQRRQGGGELVWNQEAGEVAELTKGLGHRVLLQTGGGDQPGGGNV